jgi:hypothetical protein
MPNVLICCTFTAPALVVPLLMLKNTVDGFLWAEFLIVEFSNVFDTLCECGSPPCAHVLSERARQHVDEQKNILEMVQRSPATSKRTLSTRLGVSRTRVWRTLLVDGLYPFHPQRVQNLHPRDSVMRLEYLCILNLNT